MHDVACSSGRWSATGTEPWLELDSAILGGLAGAFAEIVYTASYWDEPVRPILRFRTGDGRAVDQIAAGPIAGCGIWIGRIPRGTRRLEISPTNRLGRFDFRIERLRRRSFLGLLADGFLRQPARARSAALTRLIGWNPESDVNLTWATGAETMRHFATWWAKRARPFEHAGLDAPRFDWSSATKIHVFIAEGDLARLKTTMESLRSQVFPAWTASLPEGSCGDRLDRRSSIRSAAATPDLDDSPVATLTCRLAPGDALRPEAFAYAIEQACRHPSHRLFYADALLVETRGSASPSFQPGWSPRMFAAGLPSEALIFVRDLQFWPRQDREHFLRHGRLPAQTGDRLPASDGYPLRRILVERPALDTLPAKPMAAPSVRAPISVIIPTRDHPDLLRRAVASIRATSRTSNIEVVVVDNGSESAAAKELMTEFAACSDTLCRSYPGTFNFSAMCNSAAAAASGDILVFLNDDTEVLSAGALDRLAGWATDPSIGAVGAKLVFPDGRLQHVGVVVGMGGSAGHFGAFAPKDDPGWAARNRTMHEVSAVTGACLAVARSKFEAVGGYDEVSLPVELSDIDLCLKLNARGWQTVVDPTVCVMHEESASRGGATFRRLDLYAEQRALFTERWRHVLRDDPFFHPGLSLYSFEAALA